MKKFFAAILSAILLSLALLSLAACKTEELGSLTDFSRPYTGIYSCEELSLSGEDKLASFEELSLELGRGGEFTIRYKLRKGSEGAFRDSTK